MKTRFILILTALLMTISCERHPNQDIPEPQPSQEYLELLNAYNAARVYQGCTFGTSSTTISFTDGDGLEFKNDRLRIHDHRGAVIPTISLNDNSIWQISGTVTGIRHSEKNDNEATPVYVCIDDNTLHIFVSNGHHLVFKYNAPKMIPTVYITTDGKAQIKDKENYVKGSIRITDPDRVYSDETEFEARMRIRGRGNSTWGMPKKPWKIKLDEKASLLGMPKDKEWCLLANYTDKTLLRNIVAMEISRICDMAWTPRMRSVDVYLNDVYQGCYTLCEHKKVSKNRVNIDVDGGDIYLEIEQQQDEPRCFWTGMGVPMMFSEPSEPSDEVFNSTVKWFKDFETILQSDSYNDSENGYAAYIDVDSFVNYYIIQELTKNIDGNLRKSSFLTKSPSGKLTMYHVWDFDLCLGNCNYFTDEFGMDNSYRGFFIKDYSSRGKDTGWYHRLFQDPAFVKKVQDRWKSIIPQLKEIPQFIDEQRELLSGAEKRNFEKWQILNEWVWPNLVVKGTYNGELEYLKTFYRNRLEWLDQNLMTL